MLLLLNEDQEENCDKPLYKELVEISIDNSLEIITSILNFKEINEGKFNYFKSV